MPGNIRIESESTKTFILVTSIIIINLILISIINLFK
ncbi:MAG: hypothetical protein ACE5D7_02650 [Fidelibacterota bacterium]